MSAEGPMNARLNMVQSLDVLKTMSRRVVLRKMRFTLIMAAIVAAVFLSSLILAIFSDSDWWASSVIYGVVLLGGALVLTWIYSRALRMARFHVAKFGEPQAVYEITDEHLRYETETGSERFPWRAFDAVWRYRDMWLLFYNPVNMLILPADQITPEVGEFIVGKVRENGGKVK